jgi:hypothetical protein
MKLSRVSPRATHRVVNTGDLSKKGSRNNKLRGVYNSGSELELRALHSQGFVCLGWVKGIEPLTLRALNLMLYHPPLADTPTRRKYFYTGGWCFKSNKVFYQTGNSTLSCLSKRKFHQIIFKKFWPMLKYSKGF